MSISQYPHFTGDKYGKAYEYVDLIILNAPEFGQLDIIDIIYKSNLPQIEKDIAKYVKFELQTILIQQLKFVEHIHPGRYALHLTEEGRKAQKAGGYKLYEQLKEQNKNSSIIHNTIGNNYGNANLSGPNSFLENRDSINPTNIPNNTNEQPTQKNLSSIISMILIFISKHLIELSIAILATVIGGIILHKMLS